MNDQSKFPGSTPTAPIAWPAKEHRSNQIQQTKSDSVPQASNVIPTTQPAKPSVAPRTTPQHVKISRVTTRTVGQQKLVTVAFIHPGGNYFQSANVYLKRAGKPAVQVSSGSKSPLVFSVPSTPAPHSIVVSSVGPWGETEVTKSPSRRVSLK